MTADTTGKEITKLETNTVARYSGALVKRALQDLATISSEVSSRGAKTKKILILADPTLDDITPIYKDLFEAEGFDVSFVAPYNRVELVYAELSRHQYDMIIPTSYVSPPSIPGLVEEIKRRFQQIKIIVIASSGSLTFINDLTKKGVDDFFSTVIDVNEVVSRVRELISEAPPNSTRPYRRITLLLPYYLDSTFAKIFEEDGIKVIWSNTEQETERIVQGTHIDLAIEWQHGEQDYPIRDLLRKYGRDTSVLLALNWNLKIPANFSNLGYVDSLVVPFDQTELRQKFLEALPITRHDLFRQTNLWKYGQ